MPTGLPGETYCLFLKTNGGVGSAVGPSASGQAQSIQNRPSSPRHFSFLQLMLALFILYLETANSHQNRPSMLRYGDTPRTPEYTLFSCNPGSTQ